MKVKRPSEPYCRESTTCNTAVRGSRSTDLPAPPPALTPSAGRPGHGLRVALPCLRGPSPPRACPGRGWRAGRPPSAYPTSGCGSSLRSDKAVTRRLDRPAPTLPRGPRPATEGHAGPCPPPRRLTDDHGLVGDFLDEAALLGLADVEVKPPDAHRAQREQQQRGPPHREPPWGIDTCHQAPSVQRACARLRPASRRRSSTRRRARTLTPVPRLSGQRAGAGGNCACAERSGRRGGPIAP